jgi:hypothetical protein
VIWDQTNFAGRFFSRYRIANRDPQEAWRAPRADGAALAAPIPPNGCHRMVNGKTKTHTASHTERTEEREIHDGLYMMEKIHFI